MDEIERLAREAGIDLNSGTVATDIAGSGLGVDTLRRFAALVAEECAKVADGLMAVDPADPFKTSYPAMASCAASAIRAKFKEPPKEPT